MDSGKGHPSERARITNEFSLSLMSICLADFTDFLFCENESELAWLRTIFLNLAIRLTILLDTRKVLMISSDKFPLSMKLITSNFCLNVKRVLFFLSMAIYKFRDVSKFLVWVRLLMDQGQPDPSTRRRLVV